MPLPFSTLLSTLRNGIPNRANSAPRLRPCQVNRSAHAGPKRCRSLVVDGTRNQEIAVQLNLSEHTVRNYLLQVFD